MEEGTRRSKLAHAHALVGSVAILVWGIDLATKSWALQSLGPGRSVSVIPGLIRLQLISNSGAAFSFGEKMTWVFTVLATLVVVAAIWAIGRIRSRAWMVALGLVLGGALGNLTDRLCQPPSFGKGEVVDFIAYGTWFIGNVADIAICAAGAMILILTLRGVAIRGKP